MKLFKRFVVCYLSLILIVTNLNVTTILANDLTEDEKSHDAWKLVWSDEFDGDEIDMNNWSFDHPENGRYNQEIQSYTDKNAWVENGYLVIEAREEEITEPNGETYNYTSSKLITKGKQTWTYGKIEVLAKMPEGQGMWPAIWMMPEDEPFYGTWPVGGEIDIMELLGHEPHKVHANIHYGDPKGESQGTYELKGGKKFSDDFYLYTLEWEPGEIRWYINNELYHTANNWHSKHPSNADEFTYPAPFDQDFFLILNISVGGGWPGNPDETTELPQQMVVDYVRVYQKDEYPIREKPELPEDVGAGRAPLEDGNYVYNGNFNIDSPEVGGIDGVTNTAYWTYAEGPGGSATLNVEDGNLHVGIHSGGTVDYGVQLIQDPIPLEKGATYRASFKAKAETERNMIVKLGGGASRGYSDYSKQKPITLSTQWEDYQFEFLMPERTDLSARYEFNMGLEDSDIWLSDIKLEKIADAPTDADPVFEPRSPLPTGNYIYNGTFDQGKGRMGFWEFRTDSSADADKYIGSKVLERRFNAHINNGGDKPDSIQLVQTEINLEKDNNYQLVFDASADAPRNINVTLVTSNGDLITDQIVEINEETKQYEIYFDVEVETGNNVELQFNLGGSNENVYLDNVELTRVLEWDGIENNLIKNGIFDSLAHWSTEFNHSEAKFSVDDNGHFKVNITDVGYDTWAIQLYQLGVNLEQGETYQVSFDAKSTIERPILFHMEHKTNFTKYFDTKIDLKDEWTTYQYEFTMTEVTDPDTKFGFSFGGDGTNQIPNIEHDILVDNIVLTKVDDIDDNDPTIPGDEEEVVPGDGEETTPTDEDPVQVDDDETTPTDEDPVQVDDNETTPEEVDEPTTDDEGKSDESTKDADNGQRLPETATGLFNTIFIGVILITTGLVIVFITKRRTGISRIN